MGCARPAEKERSVETTSGSLKKACKHKAFTSTAHCESCESRQPVSAMAVTWPRRRYSVAYPGEILLLVDLKGLVEGVALHPEVAFHGPVEGRHGRFEWRV